MYAMTSRTMARVALRAPAVRKEKWERAANRAGVSLSDWMRRGLDELAEAQLITADDEPLPPSPRAVSAAVKAHRALAGHRGDALRARVKAAKGSAW
jgi:uncharacterized protein (DUF1778 family)